MAKDKIQENTQENPDEDMSVEEAFASLRELIAHMEQEGISLEDSFADYEKGVRLLKLCNDKIDRVEKKVQKMNAEWSLNDFE
jgi:exodeoxyribonuclease VII small subunit